MRRLFRPAVGPVCLSRYQHGRDPWSSTTQPERDEIRSALNLMQGRRCAYCEGSLENGCHIEHFRQRKRYPQGTFDWNNLFASCNRSGTCGDHKDSCAVYPHQDLIKPDVEDPEAFLVFAPDGTVHPREKLNDRDLHRARMTIDILKLDGALNQTGAAK